MNLEWMFGIGVSSVIALQSYILLKLVALEVRMAELRVQLGRIVSDTESEKGTRKRINQDLEQRIRNLETYHARTQSS